MVQCQAFRSQGYTAPPAPKYLKRGMFLPNNPSNQDIWLKPQQMTLAYAQVFQYWEEEANLPVPSEPCPLVMSVRQLREHIGKYTTFNEHDVFKGLGNTLPEAEDKDMGTPPVDSTASSSMTDVKDTQFSHMETQLGDDPISLLPVYKSEAKDEDTVTPLADSTASPAMTDAEDTQPSPVGTPLAHSTASPAMTDAKVTPPSPVEAPPADDTTVPVAKSNTGIQKDLPATWGASPARLEDPVVPTAILVDKLAGPPTLAICMVRGQEYLQWIKVHSSQKAATVGSVPYKSGGPWQHCSCSSKQRKSLMPLRRRMADLGDVSRSASSEGSPEPAPWDEEGKGADLKGTPRVLGDH